MTWEVENKSLFDARKSDTVYPRARFVDFGPQ